MTKPASPSSRLIAAMYQATLLIEHNLGVSVAQSFALKRLDMDFLGRSDLPEAYLPKW